MKVGDLVRITQENLDDFYGRVGIITKIHCDGFEMAVYFTDGEGFWFCPDSFEVISESR
jgi:hypothetical protein